MLSGRDRLVVLTGVLALGTLGLGVLLSPPGTDGGVPRASPTPAAPTLVEGIVGRATSVNPLAPRNAADLDLLALVFSGLTRSLPDGSVGPDLAERWTISSDRMTYTFTVRAGARWHDGQSVTADDVVFTVLTIQNPEYSGPLRSSWRSVQVEKLDTRTVRFTLAEPVGAFLQATALPILPAHVFTGIPVTSLGDTPFNRQPVGSGPYRLVRLDFDEAELVLADPRADDVPADLRGSWPGGGAGGGIPRLIVRFYPDGAALGAAYRAGLVDAAAGLTPEEAETLAAMPRTRVLRYPSTTLTAVVPNLRPGHPYFTDVNVRRALLEALDRDGLVEGLLGGSARRADSPISPSSWAYDGDRSTVHAFDRDAAVKDLETAGWKRQEGSWRGKDGQPVEFSLATIDAAGDPLGNAAAKSVAADWQAIGLAVEVVAYSADGFVLQLLLGSFDMALLDVNMGLDPDVFPLLTSSQALEGGSNVGGYQSAALDKLLKEARLGVDRAARRSAFGALQEALTRDLPILPIVFADEVYIVRQTVEGPDARLIADRSGRFWDVLTWRLADGRTVEAP